MHVAAHVLDIRMGICTAACRHALAASRGRPGLTMWLPYSAASLLDYRLTSPTALWQACLQKMREARTQPPANDVPGKALRPALQHVVSRAAKGAAVRVAKASAPARLISPLPIERPPSPQKLPPIERRDGQDRTRREDSDDKENTAQQQLFS